MLKIFNEINLISPIQLGFKSEDPCIINQLISTAHEIYESLDARLEKRREIVEFYGERYEAVFLAGIW